MTEKKKLSNIQLELLNMFQYDINEQQLLEVKKLLTNYFAECATKEMDRLWEDNQWDNETMKNWANEHLRAKH